MNACPDRLTLLLGECDLLTLADAIGSVVTVRSGSVWITQEREAVDHVVRAGERFRIDRGGRTVLQAFGEAEVSVGAAPCQARPSSRLLRPQHAGRDPQGVADEAGGG